MKHIQTLIQNQIDIQKIIEYNKQLLEGKSPFLLMDRGLAEKFFPTQLRQALIDEVLKDLDDSNQLFNES